MELRSEVKWFAEQMERVLRKNDHKGGWRESHTTWLFRRLDDETVELRKALGKNRPFSKKTIDEAVDVANFAMMIADNINFIIKENEQYD